MTTIDEKYRAIQFALELLTDIDKSKITDLEEIKKQAHVVLRHFPDSYQIQVMQKIDERFHKIS